MIKQLVQLVMPKALSITSFAAFAVASFIFGVTESKRQERKIVRAQDEQRDVETGIREEQAVRERRKQARLANIQQAQAESIQLSQSGQVAGGDSGGVGASISGNLGRNLDAINFSLASGSSISAARTGVANAGRPSTFGLVNQQVQPLLFSNIDKLDTFFESAFTS